MMEEFLLLGTLIFHESVQTVTQAVEKRLLLWMEETLSLQGERQRFWTLRKLVFLLLSLALTRVQVHLLLFGEAN